jgi:N-acetylglucosamine-6-sulfatase
MKKALLSASAVGLALAAPAATLLPAAESHAAPLDAPNIVLIVTDDQRIDAMQTMPFVQRFLGGEGETFTGVLPTSLCCPSRTSLLTGQYSHTTGVYRNTEPDGGWPTFHASGLENETLPVALQNDGYRTALFGKYLNGFSLAPENYVPPGWNDFMAIRKDNPKNPELASGSYYDYQLTGTEPTESYGSSSSDYSTDVIANKAVNFVTQSVNGGPFFLMMTPFAPHSPYTPARQDIGTYKPTPYDNAAVNEADMSDKPSFYQNRKRVSESKLYSIQEKTGEALRDVDRAVARVVEATGAERSNTLFIYMSDNGLMWGEHRLRSKNLPYRWSTEVPFIMRWDGHVAAGSTGDLAANVDVAPTVLAAAGIPDALSTSGVSLLSNDRTGIGLEAMANKGVRPAYCGIRTTDWLFVQYSRHRASELYNYNNDPLELSNLAKRPSEASTVTAFRKQAKAFCAPSPPGFSWARNSS